MRTSRNQLLRTGMEYGPQANQRGDLAWLFSKEPLLLSCKFGTISENSEYNLSGSKTTLA